VNTLLSFLGGKCLHHGIPFSIRAICTISLAGALLRCAPLLLPEAMLGGGLSLALLTASQLLFAGFIMMVLPVTIGPEVRAASQSAPAALGLP